MTAATEAPAADGIAAAFEAALAQDAGGAPAAPAADAPAPPARAAAPAGRPARKPRPARLADEAPRTAPPAPPPQAAEKYAAGLAGTGELIWLAAAVNHGGRYGPVAVPDTRAYAALFRQHMPHMAAAWGEAAAQNASVRRVVSRLAGDGGGSWVLGVAVSSAMFAVGCASIARPDAADARAALAADTDSAVAEYLHALGVSLAGGAS